MIELNKKTQQDFLSRKWVQKLLNAGVDMSDAKYIICHPKQYDSIGAEDKEVIALKKEINFPGHKDFWTNVLPTYTVSELLYKLHEWIYPTIDGVEYSGGLRMFKDAPFYIFYYQLHTKDNDKIRLEDYIYADFEYPIESLASLLIQCHMKDIGIKTKDTGDISDK